MAELERQNEVSHFPDVLEQGLARAKRPKHVEQRMKKSIFNVRLKVESKKRETAYFRASKAQKQ